MWAERHKYFRNFESARKPDISWPELINQQKVFAPWVVKEVLQEAKEFLITREGKHQARRKELSPEWFDPWIYEILPTQAERGNRLISSINIMPIERVSRYLRDSGYYSFSGVLNVGGAEGHPGHLFCARHMIYKGFYPVWIFEPDEYFDIKVRGAPFLTLDLRLSMWANYFDYGIVTVAPNREQGVSIQTHYQELFNLSGARYSLATRFDPNAEQKISRGDFHPDLIIPYINTPRTTKRVRRLISKVSG
jgi:hypothetical protein